MIWVIKDDTRDAGPLLELLDAYGYAASAAAGPDIAYRLLLARPELVLLDCAPEVCLRVLREVRSHTVASDLPLVVFGAADAAWQDRLIAAGANGFVRKGEMDWAELLEHLHRHAAPGRRGAGPTLSVTQ